MYNPKSSQDPYQISPTLSQQDPYPRNAFGTDPDLEEEGKSTMQLPKNCYRGPFLMMCVMGEKNQVVLTAQNCYSLETDWVHARPRFGWEWERKDSAYPPECREVMPLILVFPSDWLYSVMVGLESNLAVSQACYRGTGTSGEVVLKDGPLQILRFSSFDILATIPVLDPSIFPVLNTPEGKIPNLRPPLPEGAFEIGEMGELDLSWEASQLSTMNHMARRAKAHFGDAWLWAPILPTPSVTAS